ncbi:MAG: hypothetical protein QXS17_03805, partial [Candidatus Micrarchaeaceae archaeon]
MTPQQGIEEVNLAAELGTTGTALSPSQNAALLGSLVASGLTYQQAQQAIASLTPAQITWLQQGLPYTIYFNTPQGITSSYTPQQASYAAWQASMPNSSTAILPGNMPLGSPTQGMGGQYPLPLASQNSPLYTANTLGQQTPLSLNQYTNTNQTSSSNLPWYDYIPSAVVSTAGRVANWFASPFEQFQPGGAPLAGGQFPNNYPYTPQDIKNIAKTNPALAKAIQDQYNQLLLQSTHAYPETMTNAGYQYLGSPSPSGDVLNYMFTPAQMGRLYIATGAVAA